VDAPAESVALWTGKLWLLWGSGAGQDSTESRPLDRAIANEGTLVNSFVFVCGFVALIGLALARSWRPALVLGFPIVYASLVFPTLTRPVVRYGLAPGLLLAIPAALLLVRLPRIAAASAHADEDTAIR
jgi:hypothetical protein